MQISITNISKAPRNMQGQRFYLKLAEHGTLIHQPLNMYGLRDLAATTKDNEFIEAAKGINFVNIKRDQNKITVNF